MSSQPGIDYESLLHRLHGGLCEFQNLRDRRRPRPADTPPVASVQSPPAAAAASSAAEAFADMPLPQGYVTVGGRLVPFYGEVQARSAAPVTAAPPTAPTRPARRSPVGRVARSPTIGENSGQARAGLLE